MKKLWFVLFLTACSSSPTPPDVIKGSEVEAFAEACSPSGELYGTASCEDYP